MRCLERPAGCSDTAIALSMRPHGDGGDTGLCFLLQSHVATVTPRTLVFQMRLAVQ